jgi:hypothetical protein
MLHLCPDDGVTKRTNEVTNLSSKLASLSDVINQGLKSQGRMSENHVHDLRQRFDELSQTCSQTHVCIGIFISLSELYSTVEWNCV